MDFLDDAIPAKDILNKKGRDSLEGGLCLLGVKSEFAFGIGGWCGLCLLPVPQPVFPMNYVEQACFAQNAHCSLSHL